MLLRPNMMVDAAYEVTPEVLVRLGVTAVMVDLDDTILASGSNDLANAYRSWLIDLRNAGFGVLILSNGDPTRVAHWARQLGVEGFALAGKPLWPAFRRGLRRLGTRPHETAMVGDQLFTDVLGANVAGLVSILVRPLTPGKLPHTRAARKLERLFLRR